MNKIAVYPGSFDPITNGHLDIIKRGVSMFDEIIVLIAYNVMKTSLFTVEERAAMIREALGDRKGIRGDSYDGLLVDYVRDAGANIILRGLRAMSEFEYEFQLALMNRRINRSVETVFFMTGYKWFYTSSTIIKEVARLGGSPKGLVPEVVYRRMQEKFPKMNKI